jgi:catechol 2,3-dioxygenase-like lactoylglutathione lyase family enzyme
MPQHISQFVVTVRDYDEALAFYVGKLGFEKLDDTDLGGGKRWVASRATRSTQPRRGKYAGSTGLSEPGSWARKASDKVDWSR